MTDLISRADAIEVISKHGDLPFAWWKMICRELQDLPSAELPKGDLISRADAIEAVCDGCVWYKTASCEEGKEEWECSEVNKIRHLPSADAVPIRNDGTLEVKVPNAHKVGRVLVMDTDSHIGGGLFYPDDAVQGEWVDWLGNGNEWECSICKCSVESHGSIAYKYCPMCGARMKGGDTE